MLPSAEGIVIHTILASGLALQALLGPSARHDVRGPDSLALIDSVAAAELRFFDLWAKAWKASEGERHALAGVNGVHPGIRSERGRYFYLHCWPDWGDQPRLQSKIASEGNPLMAVCPSWLLGPENSGGDEREHLDAALAPKWRIPIAESRRSLIAVLESAARIMPTNDWVVGQLIRFLVDAPDYARALDASRTCRAGRAWCADLVGYVYAARGELLRADSAFMAVDRARSPGDRCQRTAVGALLSVEARSAYNGLSCAEQDVMNQRLWWLADPLYVEPGNARRVEQNVRAVLVALRTALPRDERSDWRDRAGGDAKKEMIARYGWPSYLYWGGYGEDALQHYSMRPSDGPSWIAAPFTTHEYTVGRLHLVPPWNTIEAPFTAQAADLSVGHPQELGGPETHCIASQLEARFQCNAWWPLEHFMPRAPIIQLPDGQVALLRRQSDLILATALELPGVELGREPADTVALWLVATPCPDSLRIVDHRPGTAGSVARLSGRIDAQPTLAGVEFLDAGNRRPAGRSRFGIVPPPPLSALPSGTIAVSDPVLLNAAISDDDLPSDPESALQRMAASTRLRSGQRIGVYWETYGLQPTDSAEIAVWVERYTPQGLLRRIAIAVNAATDLNTPVAVSWKEQQLGRNAHFVSGTVPVVARTVTLDVSRLPKGEYWLDVTAGRPGAEPARGRRSFVVE